MSITRYALMAFLSLPLVACGGGGGSDPDGSINLGPDAEDGDGPDAGDGDQADASGTPQSCPINETLAALGDIAGAAGQEAQQDMNGDPTDQKILFFLGAINADEKPDVITIELWEGYEPFEAGFAPGEYELTGPQLDYNTCGVCVLGLANLNPANNMIDMQYFATQGTVTLTSVEGSLTGTLSNMELQQMDQDGNVVPTGCSTSFPSGAFNAEIMSDEMPADAGTPDAS